MTESQVNCKECSKTFLVTDSDQSFYEKMQVPPPTRCPQCRQRRRFSLRNEHVLYRGTCASTGAAILTMYPPESGLTIYEQKAWWGDSWNGLDYGREFDFTRPFFEQFAELKKQVPHLNLCNDSQSIGCDYVNQTSYIKNCYLVFDCDYCEQTYFSHTTKHSQYCMDCFRAFHCELCYECIDCTKCYNLQNSQNCEDCSDSFFLKNCKGVKNSFGCINLRHKEYCFLNEQLTKEEYEARLAEWKLDTVEGREHARAKVEEWFLQFPEKENHNVQIENSSGDYLRNAKNSTFCFDCGEIWDSSYCTNVSEGVKDCMDYDVWGFKAERVYECITVGENAFNMRFSKNCWANVNDMTYCDFCPHSSFLFGCVGLKKNKYCILNKQYTKEEYEKLVPKIIEHMKGTGEWGEFFPPSLSPFGYNDTIAQDYYPLTKDEAIAKGFKWSEGTPKTKLPESNFVLTCAQCDKNFRLITQEIDLYKKMGIPNPKYCLDCRHAKRLQKRTDRMLYDRECANCKKGVTTSFSPARKEIVWCEECYLENVY